ARAQHPPHHGPGQARPGEPGHADREVRSSLPRLDRGRRAHRLGDACLRRRGRGPFSTRRAASQGSGVPAVTPLLSRRDVPDELLRIPVRRNLVLLPVLVGLLATTWWLPVHFAHRPWILVAAALAFGALTQPAYALLH